MTWLLLDLQLALALLVVDHLMDYDNLDALVGLAPRMLRNVQFEASKEVQFYRNQRMGMADTRGTL